MKLNTALNIIIGVLVLILLFKSNDDKTQAPIIIRDTTYIHVRDTVKGDVVYVGGKVDTLWNHRIEYKPDTNYNNLLEQYMRLGDALFAQNVFKSNYQIEYGSITTIDTIKENRLIGSSLFSDITVPVITQEATSRTQLYIGGGLQGDPSTLINGVSVGLLYKNRKDRIYGANVEYNFLQQSPVYEVTSYWKINLRKK